MKIFLIIAGFFAALMILVIIIAVSRPSFEERRESEDEKVSKAPKEAKKKFRFGWLVIFLAVLAGIWVLKTKTHFPSLVVSSITYPIAADAQDIWPRIGETVKVKIYPDRWSGWVNLPPRVKSVVDAPGDIEYLFLCGERLSFKDKSVEPIIASSCSFRIRGTAGEVALTVEPFVAIQ